MSPDLLRPIRAQPERRFAHRSVKSFGESSRFPLAMNGSVLVRPGRGRAFVSPRLMGFGCSNRLRGARPLRNSIWKHEGSEIKVSSDQQKVRKV